MSFNWKYWHTRTLVRTSFWAEPIVSVHQLIVLSARDLEQITIVMRSWGKNVITDSMLKIFITLSVGLRWSDQRSQRSVAWAIYFEIAFLKIDLLPTFYGVICMQFFVFFSLNFFYSIDIVLKPCTPSSPFLIFAESIIVGF